MNDEQCVQSATGEDKSYFSKDFREFLKAKEKEDEDTMVRCGDNRS